MVRECYEIVDDVCYDEKGNIIPDDTPENVEIEDFVKEFTYPLMILEWNEDGFDRMRNVSIICIEFVELKEFQT